MDSNLKRQLERLSSAEIDTLRQHIFAKLDAEKEITAESAISYWRRLKKLEQINSFAQTVGLAALDLSALRTKGIDQMRNFGIDPADVGETWTSLGVRPWEILAKASVVDLAFIEKKLQVKEAMITLVKTNPTIDEAGFDALLASTFTKQDAGLAQFLWREYVNNAYAQGLIPTPDYISMRDFVVNTPPDVLRNL